jgi:hypothetical protein
MFCYSAFGLSIHSLLPLPELLDSDPAMSADVNISMEKASVLSGEIYDREHAYWGVPNDMCLFWRDVGLFRILNGQEIVIHPHSEAETSRLRLFLLGAAFAVLLHQREYFVLHASSVTVGNQAIAFIADKGWGKSTMAATLHTRGHNLVSDDVLALKVERNGVIQVMPAFPQFKLWPDAVTFLGDEPNSLPKVSPMFDKRLLSDEYLKSHFLQCTQIVSQVGVSRLTRPPSLEALPEVAKILEEDVLNLWPATQVHLT